MRPPGPTSLGLSTCGRLIGQSTCISCSDFSFIKVLEELNDLLATESEAVETALPDVPTEDLPEPEAGEPAAVAAAPQKTKTKQAMLAS